MEGRIVFEGRTGKDNHIIIRYPTRNDAKAMWEYINLLSKEQTFITYQGEKISLEEETEYLKKMLEKIEKRKAIQLLVFLEDKLIGISGIEMEDKTSAHEGVLGISIAKESRGEGIGKRLMECMIDEAIKNLPQARIITLGVFGNNPLAMEMYKKFGFREFGRLPEGILYKGQYIDHIYMYKKVRE